MRQFARTIGVGQRAVGDARTEAHVIELVGARAKAGFDVRQTISVSQLREGRAEKLVEMRKCLGGIFGRVTLHTAAERVKG